MSGKFVVIYGPPNLGKSTQIALLANRLKESGKSALPLKYPIYYLEPTGPAIDAILRPTDPAVNVSSLELQILCAQNRRHFQPMLKQCLKDGVNMLAEDYVLTGIVWGITKGISKAKLEELNRGLIKPDIAILLDGDRRQFSGGIEKNHIYETDEKAWLKARLTFLELAGEYGLDIVNANQTEREVANNIWDIVSTAT